jgi:hypothetical protein
MIGYYVKMAFFNDYLYDHQKSDPHQTIVLYH